MGIILKNHVPYDVHLEQYETLLKIGPMELTLLGRGYYDYYRLLSMIKKVDSSFLLPKDERIKLESYVNKLIKKAYNFIILYKGEEIGVLSLYANDYSTKIAFGNIIGILEKYRGTGITKFIADFCFDFSKEKGMDFLRTHVNKNNLKSIGLLQKYHFEIEGEKDESTWIFIKDLRF